MIFSLDVTTPHDSYAWNYRELATLLALSESLVEGGFELLNTGLIGRSITTELS